MGDKYDFMVGDQKIATLPDDAMRPEDVSFQSDETAKAVATFKVTYLPDMLGDVRDFLDKFGQERATFPRALDPDYRVFRNVLHREEGEEWMAHAVGLEFELGKKTLDRAEVLRHMEGCLDACVDAVYVYLGTALSMFPEDAVREAWRRVQAANMAKVRSTSTATSGRGSSHDVVKPPGWVAPDHSDLVEACPYGRET